MIRQIAINKIRFILGITIFFLIGYILGVNFSILTLLVILYWYLKILCPTFSIKSNNLLNISFLFVIIFFIGYFMAMKGLSLFYIPYALIPMLATLLFNDMGASLLLTLASSITIGSIFPNAFDFTVLFIISGTIASILIQGARRRSTIIRVGLIVGIIQAITLFFIEHFIIFSPDKDLSRYLVLILNGIVSSVIAVGILPIFEYLFKTLTNISLLELADFNHPLLQRMILEAPGTYHHSLIVGNLSEAACQAVGANALLARIGAYYHDIGKINKPEYFSENQGIAGNKHDELAPTMSKMVIMNHVKDGVEVARKYKLNQVLIDFIKQHHGTSLVYYFYRRALERLEDENDLKEDVFRYPGPKPSTKETAIVLLADSVEAATRALKDPNPNSITEVVHKVINNKFIDGQLDECDLTLKDLEKISKVFIHILSGIYHSRITYPESSR